MIGKEYLAAIAAIYIIGFGACNVRDARAALTEADGVISKPQSFFTGTSTGNTCVTGRIGMVQGTSITYECVAGRWRRYDVPFCTSTPAGTCDYRDICINATNNALYFCKNLVWAAVGTAAGTATCLDQDVDGTCEVRSDGTSVTLDPADDGTPAYSFKEDTCVNGDQLTFNSGAGGILCQAPTAATSNFRDLDVTGDGTADLSYAKPWQAVEIWDDLTSRQLSGGYLWGPTGNGSCTITQINGATTADASPESGTSAQLIARMSPNNATNNYCSYGYSFSAATANGFDEQQLVPTKVRYFRTRTRYINAANQKKLLGCFRTSDTGSSTQAFITKTDGFYLWCEPGADVDNDGTVGDSNNDGDCADGGEDADNCNWFLVTQNNAVDDATGKLAAATNTTVTNTGKSCVNTTNFQVWGLYNTGTTIQAYYDDDGGEATTLAATNSTNLPTAARLVNGCFIIDQTKTAATFNVDIDYMYYLGDR